MLLRLFVLMHIAPVRLASGKDHGDVQREARPLPPPRSVGGLPAHTTKSANAAGSAGQSPGPKPGGNSRAAPWPTWARFPGALRSGSAGGKAKSSSGPAWARFQEAMRKGSAAWKPGGKAKTTSSPPWAGLQAAMRQKAAAAKAAIARGHGRRVQGETAPQAIAAPAGRSAGRASGRARTHAILDQFSAKARARLPKFSANALARWESLRRRREELRQARAGTGGSEERGGI